MLTITLRQMVGMMTHSGLLESSMLLDVGCGALRAGKMFITFLQRGHYHCIEPNHALVQVGVQRPCSARAPTPT